MDPVRSIPAADLGIKRPTSLAVSASGRSLLVGQTRGRRTLVRRLSLLEKRLGTIRLRRLRHPSTLDFDPVRGRLTAARRDGLVALGRKGRATRVRRVRIRDPRAMTFDRARRTWYVLDGTGAIVRIRGRRPARRISLSHLGDLELRGIAHNRADGLLYVLAGEQLIALTRRGRIRRAVSLRPLELDDPRAIAFAPSADTTDDPGRLHLYVADRGSAERYGRVVESTFATRSALARSAETATASTVQIIPTHAYTPSSPDPAGIVYMAAEDRLFISDSEVDEMPWLFQNHNLFSGARTGGGAGAGKTNAFSKEPSGLGYDPATRTLYIADDDKDSIFAVRPGADGVYGTTDDVRNTLVTSTFGSTDPEGVEYDAATGNLFICDGTGLEVYEVNPVNGVIGDGNDVVTSFDVGRYDARDCEGIGIDAARGTLLAVDPSRKKIWELTKAGELVRAIDLSTVPTSNRNFASVTMAPTSDPNDAPSVLSYWVVDRQVDNGPDPNENDGLLYELVIPGDPGPAPDAPPSVTVTEPVAGSLVSGTVTIRAAASDDVGVAEVHFAVGGTQIGVDTNGADGWSAPWNTASGADGPRTVTATAIDTKGQQASDSAAVTVDNTPPSVSVTQPSAGSTVSGTVTVTAAATDADAVQTVQFRVDGASIGTDSNGADGWSVPWNTTLVANGSRTVTAVATDRAGNAATSAGVAVTVSNSSTITLASAIAVGTDDVDEAADGTVRRTNGDLELGSEQSGISTTVGMRFTGLQIPHGATIDTAHVQFTADEKGRSATSLTIRGQSADNANPFATTAYNLTSRPMTTASVPWTPPQWLVVGAAGAGERTPEIRSILQEIVNRPGWAAGNALVIAIGGNGRRTAESYEGGAPPVLHVRYTTS